MGEYKPILTRSCRLVDPLAVKPGEIVLDDIAAALAKQCRFNGHTRSFYSVAQHSIEVSRRVPRHIAAWGLLHDAAEAFVGDVVRPIKGSLLVVTEEEDGPLGMWIDGETVRRLTSFSIVEARLLASIAERFGLAGSDVPPEVEEADLRMLATEMRDLWEPGVEAHKLVAHLGSPYEEAIVPMDPVEAEAEFRHRAVELGIDTRPGPNP